MAQVYNIGFLPVDSASWSDGVIFTKSTGVKVGAEWGAEPPATATMTLDYDSIGGLAIWDENDTFSDDPQNPEWSGEPYPPHLQFVDTEGYAVNGVSYPRGSLQVENEYEVRLTGSDGNTYVMVGVSAVHFPDPDNIGVRDELGVIGVTFIGDWPPQGVTLNFSGNHDGASFPYSQIKTPDQVPCFARGTLIDCPQGPRPVEDLGVGDLVLTRDHGPQPIRWIGCRSLAPGMLHSTPNLRPIRIAKGALGAGLPAADLLVSSQHRILVRSRIAQRMFGADEVLVAAKQLLAVDGIDIAADVESVDYYHILFDRHEIVRANGAETESLYPGPVALSAIGPQARQEILTLFPELESGVPGLEPARPLIAGRQGRRLSERHLTNQRPLLR